MQNDDRVKSRLPVYGTYAVYLENESGNSSEIVEGNRRRDDRATAKNPRGSANVALILSYTFATSSYKLFLSYRGGYAIL